MAKTKGAAAVEKKNKTLEALDITYTAHDKIIPNSYNPNRQSEHEFELLRRSMSEDGFTQPIVVVKHEEQEGMYRIVDGEHRWRCAGELGFEEVPIVVTPMTLEQARIATLRHNRARGSEDIELSAQVLRDLEELGALDWAQDSLMMDDIELQKLLEDIPAPEALAGEEFETAWLPTRDISTDGTEGKVITDKEGTLMAAMTPAVLEQQRSIEKRIAEAKSEEEKQMIARETKSYYRINLVFSDVEADIVKKALVPEPAAMLLKLCEEHLLRVGGDS